MCKGFLALVFSSPDKERRKTTRFAAGRDKKFYLFGIRLKTGEIQSFLVCFEYQNGICYNER
ncbi:MAG: hypothetical protein ABH858_05880 [Candidatus Omnitrophota bacterium]